MSHSLRSPRVCRLALLTALVSLPLFGQTDLVNPAWQDPSGVQLLVTAYQQNFTLDEPVMVKATLKNVSTEPQTFILASETSFSVEFNIFDRNRNLIAKRPGVVRLAKADLKSDQAERRQIRLCPDEEFAVRVDLNNWYAFGANGRYLVQAVFHDGFNRRKAWSNPLWINLLPNRTIANHLRLEDELRQREAETVMTPEGTVSYLLDALKDHDWESFFKYTDLEKLILLYSPWAQEWQSAADDDSRGELLGRFRNFLRKVEEYNSVANYRIQNIVFPRDSRERTVYCYVRYGRNVAVNNYLYTFHLRQRGNKWYLDGMETVITKEQDWGGFDANKNPLGPDRNTRR